MRHEPASLAEPPTTDRPDAATSGRPGRLDPPRWRIVAGGWAAAYVVGVLVALLVKATSDWNAGAAWERALMLRVHAIAIGAWGDWVLQRLADIGTSRSLGPVCAVLAVYYWWRRRRDLALWIVVVDVGAVALNFGIKYLLPRDRPDLWPKVGWFGYTPAYASGHLISSIAVLTTLALLLYREHGWRWPLVVAALVSIANAFGRMYHGVHWPTDVYGGALVGMLWLYATAVGFNVLPGGRAPDRGRA